MSRGSVIVVVVIVACAREWLLIAMKKKTPVANEAPYVAAREYSPAR